MGAMPGMPPGANQNARPADAKTDEKPAEEAKTDDVLPADEAESDDVLPADEATPEDKLPQEKTESADDNTTEAED
jgi:hypothetical protein